jgi:hypothetical protein
MSHTPGPWTWWTSNSWRRLKHDNRGKTANVLEPTVCHDGQPDCIISGEDMALIAAAPEMLEALRAVAPLMIPGMNWTDETGQLVKKMVRSAIAKADPSGDRKGDHSIGL